MQPVGPSIDPFALCQDGRSVGGTIPVGALSRVAEILAFHDGALEYSVVGRKGGRGEPLVTLMVNGRLRLVCQRCLEPIDWPVSVQGDYVLVRPGAPWPDAIDDDDSVDVLETGPILDLHDFVEDEVILALPVSAMHEACMSPDSGSVVAAPSGREDMSPFSGLAALKSKKGAPGAH